MRGRLAEMRGRLAEMRGKVVEIPGEMEARLKGMGCLTDKTTFLKDFKEIERVLERVKGRAATM
eukprot:5375969-Pleurochrysis_carterae.AAC.1